MSRPEASGRKSAAVVDVEIKARPKKIRVFVPAHGPTISQSGKKETWVIGPGGPESGSSASGLDLNDGMRGVFFFAGFRYS